jgi:integrase
VGNLWVKETAVGKLTVKKVDSITEPGRYSDGDGTGFHLRVDAQGRKYYILRVNVGRVRKDIAIGSAKRMTLSAAREIARKKLEAIEQTDTVPVEMPSFEVAATKAHSARTEGYKNEKHRAQWLSTLAMYAYPLVGEKPISEVSRADVVAILTPIWLDKPETARRVLQRIDRVLRWAVGNNFRDDRIDMDLVRDALPKQRSKRLNVRRMPAVDWRDAPAFWHEIPLSSAAPIVRLGLSLLILTASRPGNIRTAKREQFDLRAKIWYRPGEDMKTGLPHRVPLSEEAVRIVRAAMDLHNHELLFTVGGEPISVDTLRMMMRRMGHTATPHGFRSTFKDWSLKAGYADHISEDALAHADANDVRAAYAREDFCEQRRPMMEAWASYLAERPRSGAAPTPE